MQNIPGPSVPQDTPIAPYSGTDIFANESGRWLLWTSLLFAIPATLSVFPLINGAVSVFALIPAIAVNVIGFYQSWKARIPGYRKLYPLSFPLGLLITIGTFLQLDAVSKTGNAEGSTYLAWFAMFAMFIVATIALSQAANLNPYRVSRGTRITVNTVLALAVGTTIAALFLPLIIVMGALVFVGGWYTLALFMILPLAGTIAMISLLVRQAKKDRKEHQGQTIPGKLIPIKSSLIYSGIVASVTFMGIGFWVTSYIMTGGTFSP